MARNTRTRLVAMEPTLWVDLVNPIAEKDQQKEVKRAAISPIEGISPQKIKNRERRSRIQVYPKSASRPFEPIRATIQVRLAFLGDCSKIGKKLVVGERKSP